MPRRSIVFRGLATVCSYPLLTVAPAAAAAPRAVCLLRRNVCDARRRGSHRRLGGGRRTGLRDLGHSHEKRLRRRGGLRLRSRYGVARRNRDFVAQRRLRQVGRHYLPTSAGARQASGRSARQGQPVGMVPDGQRHLGFRGGGGALSGRTSAPAPASRWSVSRKRPRLGGFPSAAGTGQSRARTIRQGTPSLPGKPWPASPGRLRSGRNSASATGTSRPRKRPSTISGPVSACTAPRSASASGSSVTRLSGCSSRREERPGGPRGHMRR